MGPQGVWQEWEAEISRVLPGVGVWQRRTLALLSLGMALAKSCGLSRVAAVVPGAAVVPSIIRRFERFLASAKVDISLARQAVAARLLEEGRGQTETGARFGMLALRLVYRERALPLAWVCYHPGEAPAPLPTLARRLIAEVAAVVPSDAHVVLLTDRGLSWPALLDQGRRRGWSFLGRVQHTTRVRTSDGRTSPIGELAPRPGTRWRGHVRAFRKAGWRDLNAVAVWRRGDKDPWLLLTDLAPDWVCCAQYRHRMDEEESFRDDKSSGFDWDHSRVRDPAHMDRLLLALQLAAAFVLIQGLFGLTHHHRHVLERQDRRTLSLFSLGLRWLDRARSHLVSTTQSLVFPFPEPETVG